MRRKTRKSVTNRKKAQREGVIKDLRLKPVIKEEAKRQKREEKAGRMRGELMGRQTVSGKTIQEETRRRDKIAEQHAEFKEDSLGRNRGTAKGERRKLFGFIPYGKPKEPTFSDELIGNKSGRKKKKSS